MPLDYSVVAFPAVWLWVFYSNLVELLLLKTKCEVTQLFPCVVVIYKTVSLLSREYLDIWSTSEVFIDFCILAKNF